MPKITVLPPPRGIKRNRAGEAVEAFLDSLAASGASPKTVKSYRAALKSFLDVVGPDTPVNSLSGDVYTQWLSKLRRSRALSKSTLHYYSIFVRRFLQWLGIVDDIPAVPGDSNTYSHALTWDQVEALLAAASDLRDLAMISLLAESGLRAGELLTLAWSDVDLVKGLVRVKGKYGKERIVLLGPVSREALARLYEAVRPRPYERIFAISYQALYKKLKRLAIKAGLDPSLVRPHVLRHTFATEALRRGMSLPALQRLLGHSDIKVTQRYLHLVTEDIEREYSKAFFGRDGQWMDERQMYFAGYTPRGRARILG